ncbi:MAG: glycosyl hydrolase family 28-related protein [Spirochaetota bacterium]
MSDRIFSSIIRACMILCTTAVIFGDDAFPEDLISRMKKINKLSDTILLQYIRYIYPPVKHPITGALIGSEEMFLTDVPAELGDQKLATRGYVDITAAPFNADVSGSADATKAIQDAVNFARDHQMACYFPAGTYRISDTVECLQKITVRENGRISGGDAVPCILIGASGKRPRLFLAPNSPGFTDPNNRKIILHVVNCNTALEIKPELGPLHPQANISFNQMVRGIDIVIGEGNAGAIGVRMQAAEGSSIQDMTIDATHGHTGMQGAAGSGGAHHNMTVIGGRVGIDTRGFPPQFETNSFGTQPGPTMSRVTLIGQTETPAIVYSTGPFTAAGWHIRTSCDVAIRVLNNTGQYYFSQMNLIDSIIEFSSPGTVAEASQGLYMRDVFASNTARIHEGVDGRTQWAHISEYAAPGKATQYKGKNSVHDIEQPVFMNGKKQTAPFIGGIDGRSPPKDLCTQHGWGDQFPSPEMKEAANVRERYGAAGDGRTDDTKALQKAVDENDIVFLPKGLYRVSDTIRLKSGTKLIGVHHTLSLIVAYDPFGALAENGPKPIVDTPDDANADTVIAFVGIRVMKWCDTARAKGMDHTAPFYALRWRTGERSMVRSPWIHRAFSGISFAGTHINTGRTNLTWKHPFILIEGNGGGKWYNFFSQGVAYSDTPDFRIMQISGTKNRLSFYHYHAQHSEGDFQCGITGSKNVNFYGVKTECETAFMRIADSSAVHIFGHAGWGSALPGLGLYTFSGGSDILLSCFGSFIRDDGTGEKVPWRKFTRTPFNEWHPVVDDHTQFKMPPTERAVLYKR